METVKLEGQLTWEDYLAGTRLHVRPGGATLALYLWFGIGAVLLAALGIYRLLQGDVTYFLLNPGLIGIAVFALYRYVFLPRRVKRIFKEQKGLSAPFEIELTEASIKMTNEFGFSETPWSTLFKWKEDEKLFLLYQSSAMFNLLPKRLFPDERQVSLVRTWLAGNVVPPPRKKPWVFVMITVLILLAMLCTLVGQYRRALP